MQIRHSKKDRYRNLTKSVLKSKSNEIIMAQLEVNSNTDVSVSLSDTLLESKPIAPVDDGLLEKRKKSIVRLDAKKYPHKALYENPLKAALSRPYQVTQPTAQFNAPLSQATNKFIKPPPKLDPALYRKLHDLDPIFQLIKDKAALVEAAAKKEDPAAAKAIIPEKIKFDPKVYSEYGLGLNDNMYDSIPNTFDTISTWKKRDADEKAAKKGEKEFMKMANRMVGVPEAPVYHGPIPFLPNIKKERPTSPKLKSASVTRKPSTMTQASGTHKDIVSSDMSKDIPFMLHVLDKSVAQNSKTVHQSLFLQPEEDDKNNQNPNRRDTITNNSVVKQQEDEFKKQAELQKMEEEKVYDLAKHCVRTGNDFLNAASVLNGAQDPEDNTRATSNSLSYDDFRASIVSSASTANSDFTGDMIDLEKDGGIGALQPSHVSDNMCGDLSMATIQTMKEKIKKCLPGSHKHKAEDIMRLMLTGTLSIDKITSNIEIPVLVNDLHQMRSEKHVHSKSRNGSNSNIRFFQQYKTASLQSLEDNAERLILNMPLNLKKKGSLVGLDSKDFISSKENDGSTPENRSKHASASTRATSSTRKKLDFNLLTLITARKEEKFEDDIVLPVARFMCISELIANKSIS